MPWIEFHTQLMNHWKIERLSDELGIEYHHALGLISCLWLWCVDYAQDGNVTRFTDRELQHGVHTKLEKFTKELLKKCELIDDKNSINDWKHHGIKYLLSTRLRVKKHRLQKRYGNVTVTPTQPNLTIPNPTKDLKTIDRPPSVQNNDSKDFEAFWAVYPRKVGKGAALKAWLKKPDYVNLELVLESVADHKRLDQWRDPKFIPHPATWLNQERWMDEDVPTEGDKWTPEQKKAADERYETMKNRAVEELLKKQKEKEVLRVVINGKHD